MSLEGSQILSALREDISETTLQQALGRLETLPQMDRFDRKLQAEVCYLLARELRGKDPRQAKHLVLKTIEIYENLDIQTLEDSVPVLGLALPNYMHQGVVRQRFHDLLR